MIYFFLLSSLRKEHFEAVGIGEKKPYCHLTDEEKINIIARSEEHTSELQSRDSISYAVFCLKKKGVYTVVRGLRALTDFDYEFMFALTNRCV